jgi:hypothetical protein
MRRLLVRIDKLVLKGFPYQDHDGIAVGLQGELKRIFADPVVAHQRISALRSLSSLQVGKMGIAPGSRPQSVGAEVARGIAKEIRS